MPKRNFTGIRNRDARVILSEVLPYELPIPFTNGGTYRFLNRVRLQRDGAKFSATNLGPGTEAALCLLFGTKLLFERDGGLLRFQDPSLVRNEKVRLYAQTNPFHFTMRHKVLGRRRMAVMHMRSQIDVMDFYARHADSILYYTSRSSFSIRYPRARARYTIHRDPLFAEQVDTASHTVEQTDHDYEYVRSYFTYERYSQVYKFYESPEFRACERKYGLLARLDISKCFDSIYTHSITWATHGREPTKANLGAAKDTFGGEFDRLMQALNYDETNGIIIGPEVSRIFAEVILQEVDVRIQERLDELGLKYREDYDILRFVDDYFVFMKTEERKGEILNTIADELATFRLHLNETKQTLEMTPLASALSIAKYKLDLLLKEEITWRDPDPDPDDPKFSLPSILAVAQSLVLGYKSILMDAELAHSELANYALVKLERKLELYLERFESILLSEEFLSQSVRFRYDAMTRVVGFMSAVMDVAVFIYAGAVSVSHSVKLARIMMTAIKFLERVAAEPIHVQTINTKVDREVRAQLDPSAQNRPVPMHSLILLDCLTALGPRHTLSAREVDRLLDLRGAPLPPTSFHVDASSVLTLIAHIRDKDAFTSLRNQLADWILNRIRTAGSVLDGEVSLLEINCMSSPFVSPETKTQILKRYGRGRRDVAQIESVHPSWTYEWSGLDYYERLQRKRANEVY